ncbi:MAG: polymerase sigma-E factor [Bacteroidota bacterium]|jgi:RNA polymerase sigma-70 factor (ECF subfamily)
MQEFKALYEQYKSMVYNLAIHYLQNLEEAEEVTQDVFVKVYQKRSNFRAEAAIKTWIYRITVNQCLDYLRSKKRKQALSKIFFWEKKEHLTINRQHPGYSLEQQESVQQILAAIHTLPEQQKTALMLVKIEGLSMEECANIMQSSEKAVESLLSRAKNNLKNKGLSSKGNPNV